MLNVTREINALVDAVVASGLGDEEGFMAVILLWHIMKHHLNRNFEVL